MNITVHYKSHLSVYSHVLYFAPNCTIFICSGIDEIVVSYVSGVLEEVAVDEEEVDSAGMKDVMAAYVPEFDAIPEDAITTWVMDMVHVISQEKSKSQ